MLGHSGNSSTSRFRRHARRALIVLLVLSIVFSIVELGLASSLLSSSFSAHSDWEGDDDDGDDGDDDDDDDDDGDDDDGDSHHHRSLKAFRALRPATRLIVFCCIYTILFAILFLWVTIRRQNRRSSGVGKLGREIMDGSRGREMSSQVPLTHGHDFGHVGGNDGHEGTGAPPDYYSSTGLPRDDEAGHEPTRTNEQELSGLAGSGVGRRDERGGGGGTPKSSGWMSKVARILRNVLVYGLVWLLAWIFWIAAAGSVTAVLAGGRFRCSWEDDDDDDDDGDGNFDEACRRVKALEAFAWIEWIILTLLLILILVLAVRSRGGSGSGWKGKLMRGLDCASDSDEEDDRSSSRDVARRTMRTN